MMKNLKRFSAFLLTLTMVFAMTAAAFAAVEDTGFSDVDADAWYAEAVEYCRDNGLMSGTSDTAFSPDEPMTRAMLATVLYRQAGSPTVAGAPDFTDTAADTWYSDAVAWAVQEGVFSGYDNGLFGTNDPITREQLAAVLWRVAGSPAPAGTAQAFADQSSIAGYAVSAAAWARENGIIDGMPGNLFAPKGNAVRAQVAAILMNYSRPEQPSPTPEPTPEQPGPTPEQPSPTPEPAPAGEVKTLVAYFSNTGNTEAVAGHLADILSADTYEILAETPYTAADLDYSNSGCRANREQNDPAARPAVSGSVSNMADYDVVFIGYPIWWGQAPKIISTFLESYDFTGKTIVPFCTSGSSSIGSSATSLHSLAPNADWLSGQRFGGGASRQSVESWVNGLALPENTAEARRIVVEGGGAAVTYELNGSQAAKALYDQLPLTVAVSDYSDNEKIFYPPTELDTSDAPPANGGTGVLAYYAPWDDVVMFYGGFGANSQLYSLGTAVSGAENIQALSGTVTVRQAA